MPTHWVCYVVLSVYFTWPVLTSGLKLGISDWDPLLLFHANVFRSVYEYGQLPFWNPWSCGGNPLWQNPQVPLISPTYLLALGMPLIAAIKLNLLLHYLIGFAGMHVLLTRVFRISFRPALIFLASLFVLAGGIALHLTVGHATFLPYFYLPWLLYSFLAAVETGAIRFCIACAAVFALGIYAGGIHIVFMVGIALGALTVISIPARRDWVPLAALAMTGALALLFAAPKLIPVLFFLRDPRLVDIRLVHPNDIMSLDMLLHAFLDPFQYLRQLFPGQNYGWHEYGNYVGSVGAVTVVAALLAVLSHRPGDRRHWLGTSLAATTVLLGLLTIGEYGPYSPYELLRRLPLVSEFRLPSRYTLVLVLFATATVAWAIRGTDDRVPLSGDLRRFTSLLLVVGACYLGYTNRSSLEFAFMLEPVDRDFHFLARPPAPRIDADVDGFSPDAPMMRATLDGRAVLRCNDSLLLRGSVRPELPVVFADGVTVSRLRFSPNLVEFSAVTRDGGRVYLNERYMRGWDVTAGKLEIDPGSELAYMALPPGAAGRFAFRFLPAGLWTGGGCFLLGLVLSFVLRTRSLTGARAAGRAPSDPRS